jgi:RHS repeat-associated protein
VTYNGSRSAPPTTTDYVKGIEYVNHVMTSIYHDEGRLVQVNGTWQSEYVLKDHLGNTRVTFRDVDGNGIITATDITQEANYYPFGMQMEGDWSPAAAVRIPYLYNGIEQVSDLGLNINTAFFRTLDPALGRWWQIDPKSEAIMSLSPYNAMNNNPISFNDPNGDLAWFVPVIFAAVNVAADLIVNKGKMNFGEIALSAGSGALSGLLSGGGSVGQAFLSAGLSQLNRFLPSIPLMQSDAFSIGLSPTIGFGTSGFSFGASVNASGRSGDFAWSLSVGIGFNSGMSSLGESAGGSRYWNLGGFAGYNDGHANYGIGLSTNAFSGKTAQRVGAITLQIGDFGLRVDEDYLPVIGDGKDRYRTGGLLATYRINDDVTLAFGAAMITGQRGHRTGGGNPNIEDGQYASSTEYHKYLRAGTVFGGAIYKGQSFFAGHNSEKSLHSVQNWIHRKVLRTTPYFPDRHLSSKFYSYYGGYHPNYLFY